MNIVAVGKSDVGLVRKKNQDAFGLFPDMGLYVVADGMGGLPAGEIASQMTVDRLQDFFFDALENTSEESLMGRSPAAMLHDGICHANKKVFEAAMANPAYYGMGTTVVALWMDPFRSRRTGVQKTEAWIGFAGDSRAYHYRNNILRQVTQDHSVVNEYIRMGVLTPEAARHHPNKHMISRGIGVASTVLPETLVEPVDAGDLFLLCTDGLSNMLDCETISAILQEMEGQPLEAIATALVEGAKQHGGRDNITVILVAYDAPS